MGMQTSKDVNGKNPERERLHLFHSFVRFMRNTEENGSCASCHSSEIHDSYQTGRLDPQTYLAGQKRMNQLEAEKALIIIESHHERWKAGGVY